MAFFNEFPHTRTYDNDLGWLIWAMKKLIADWENFSNLNSIKFADPINWTIDRNYEPAMIVLDNDGNGYISRKAVPAGVPLNNEDYWTQIFNFGDITNTIRENIAYNANDSATTPITLTGGQLVWWNGELYRVLYDIAAGTAFIVGTNIEKITVEQFVNKADADLDQRITNLQTSTEESIADINERIEELINMHPDRIYYSDVDLAEALADNRNVLLYINNDVTFSEPIPSNISIVHIGGLISGTVTINGLFVSTTRTKVFADNAIVTDNGNNVGRPEWFGAVTNNAAFNCAPAINKTLQTFRIVELSAEDYYITETIIVNRSRTKIYGPLLNSDLTAEGSSMGARIVCPLSTITAMQIGTGTSSRTVTQIYISDIAILCTNPDYSNAESVGLFAYGVRAIHAERVYVSEFRSGIKTGEITASYFKYCRVINSNTDDANTVIAFHIAGQLESLFLNDCDVTYTTEGGALNFGVYGNIERLADFWINGCMFSRARNGIQLIGRASTDGLQQDIYIVNNIIDNCIEAIRISQNLKVAIDGNWISCGRYSNDTARAIHLVSSYGGVSITGNHLKGADTAENQNFGFRFENSRNIITAGNEIIEFDQPVYASGSRNIKMRDMVVNHVRTSTHNAVVIDNCVGVEVSDGLGGEVAFPTAIQVTGSSSYVNVNPAAIDANCVTNAKVIIAGVAQTNANAFQVLAKNNTIIGAM